MCVVFYSTAAQLNVVICYLIKIVSENGGGMQKQKSSCVSIFTYGTLTLRLLLGDKYANILYL